MKQGKKFIVDILFVLALFGIFAVSALVLVTIGADVYQHTVRDMSSNYEIRTSIAYITEKVRQNDSYNRTGDGVTITEVSGTPALVLTQEINGELYDTYLYLYEGYLKELFMRKDNYVGEDFLPAGQDIMPLRELAFEKSDAQLLTVHMTITDGHEETLYVSLRSEN